MNLQSTRVMTTAQREFLTLLRSRTVLILGNGYALAVISLAFLSGLTGYVPVVLGLLTPVEILVPVLAVALGYRTFVADRDRGELAVIQTFPGTKRGYVVGAYLGRIAVFLLVVLFPLISVGLIVGVFGHESTFLVTHSGIDSPILYARFLFLTTLFALVVFGPVLAVSAISPSRRQGFALGVLLIVMIAVGVDLAIVAGLALDAVSDGSLQWLLALSPGSSYRGLVMRLVVAPAATFPVLPASPFLNVVGLVLWWVGSLAFATWRIWTPSGRYHRDL